MEPESRGPPRDPALPPTQRTETEAEVAARAVVGGVGTLASDSDAWACCVGNPPFRQLTFSVLANRHTHLCLLQPGLVRPGLGAG